MIYIRTQTLRQCYIQENVCDLPDQRLSETSAIKNLTRLIHDYAPLPQIQQIHIPIHFSLG